MWVTHRTDLDDAAADVRRAGLRCTVQRVAVLGLLRSERRHWRVDEVADAVRQALDGVSTQTVYDALGALTSAGLLRRIEPAGSPALFESRTGDNHHHLVCRSCGAAVDTDCAVGRAPCLQPSDAKGFVIDEADVIYWGTCPACTPSRRTGGER